jgi:chemotaxis methyl-accepting protein methylase
MERLAGVSDLAFFQFLAWLKQRCGLDWTQYRRDYLERRLGVCMSARGVRSYPEYTSLLDRDPQALEELRNAITINVTEFFRDASTFAAFRQEVIPEVVASKRKGGTGLVRVWSAGCATGEEAFSIALCFLEMLGNDLSGLWVSIYATDVDQDCLRQARTGVYSREALAPVPETLVQEFFQRQQDGTFAAGEALRRLVRFQRQDLIHDEPLKHVDVIFCRYVFIYMSRELQERVLRAFHRSLNREGFLVLGRTESMPVHLLEGLFVSVNPEERIYRKRAAEV